MVSIIVPVYNIKEYIAECLESIRAQTCRDIEVIVVDDGSTDGSGAVCDAFAAEDERIRVIHKNNEGLVKARKEGLTAAHGDYVCYVDGDDYIEREMIERSVDLFGKQGVDVVLFGSFTDFEGKTGRRQQNFDMGHYSRERLKKEVFPHMISSVDFMEFGITPMIWDKVFRRELLLKHQMNVDDTIRMGEDAACVYPCLLDADSVYISNECYYHYRQRNTSMIRSSVIDGNEERRRFEALYKCGAEQIGQADLISQWRDYLLFLMTPRADYLYEGIEGLDYLFPYPNVKRGDSVIIYGAGVYGARLYAFLKKTGFCDVKAVVDRDYANLSTDVMPVLSPEQAFELEADHVILALSYGNTRKAVYEYLRKRLPEDKIAIMDMDLVRSPETWRAFGMPDDMGYTRGA